MESGNPNYRVNHTPRTGSFDMVTKYERDSSDSSSLADAYHCDGEVTSRDQNGILDNGDYVDDLNDVDIRVINEYRKNAKYLNKLPKDLFVA